MGELLRTTAGVLERAGGASGMPALIVRAGARAENRFLEFFAAQIRNPYTREAYLRAVRDFLGPSPSASASCSTSSRCTSPPRSELKMRGYEAQSVKQQLAGLRHFFDWLVVGQILTINPASFVRGPKFSCAVGNTPILSPAESRQLIRAIPTDTRDGLRDRALIGLMVYTSARVSAAVGMNVKDVFPKQDAL